MPAPELWIIAGPNGAGKTTTVQRGGLAEKLSGATFINLDALTLQYLNQQGITTWEEAPPEVLKQTFVRAANESTALLEELIEQGCCVAIESVLSTRKYCDLVEKVLSMGGDFYLVYVALNSPDISAQRVGNRASLGGHDVPRGKLEPRWRVSLELLPWFAVRAAKFFIVDNSDSSVKQPPTLLVSGEDGVVCVHGVPAPSAKPLVADFINSFTKLDTAGRWRFDFGDAYSLQDEFRFVSMAVNEGYVVDGVVTESLATTIYRVRLAAGDEVLAIISDDLRKKVGRLVAGCPVKLRLDHYDKDKVIIFESADNLNA